MRKKALKDIAVIILSGPFIAAAVLLMVALALSFALYETFTNRASWPKSIPDYQCPTVPRKAP